MFIYQLQKSLNLNQTKSVKKKKNFRTKYKPYIWQLKVTLASLLYLQRATKTEIINSEQA